MDLFTEGQKLTLFIQKEDIMVEILCSIQKILDDRLDVLLPGYFMRYIEYLQPNKRLTLKAFSKFGTVDFNSVVISSPLEDSFVIELDYNSVKLTPSEEIPSVNAIEELELRQNLLFSNYKTFELSTEYLKFSSDKPLELYEIYNCSLYLPEDYGIIEFKGMVTEVDPLYSNEYTLIYSTMSETMRQSLLYYIYKYDRDTN